MDENLKIVTYCSTQEVLLEIFPLLIDFIMAFTWVILIMPQGKNQKNLSYGCDSDI